jgi:hypothetical protein
MLDEHVEHLERGTETKRPECRPKSLDSTPADGVSDRLKNRAPSGVASANVDVKSGFSGLIRWVPSVARTNRSRSVSSAKPVWQGHYGDVRTQEQWHSDASAFA